MVSSLNKKENASRRHYEQSMKPEGIWFGSVFGVRTKWTRAFLSPWTVTRFPGDSSIFQIVDRRNYYLNVARPIRISGYNRFLASGKFGRKDRSCGFKTGLCIPTLSNFQFFGWYMLENRCKLVYGNAQHNARIIHLLPDESKIDQSSHVVVVRTSDLSLRSWLT